MKTTMKRVLATLLALMLAVPAFAHAEEIPVEDLAPVYGDFASE